MAQASWLHRSKKVGTAQQGVRPADVCHSADVFENLLRSDSAAADGHPPGRLHANPRSPIHQANTFDSHKAAADSGEMLEPCGQVEPLSNLLGRLDESARSVKASTFWKSALDIQFADVLTQVSDGAFCPFDAGASMRPPSLFVGFGES